MDHSAIDFLSKSANRKVRKLLGRAYLRENRIGEALEVYQGLLAEIPDDTDVLMILGNLYRLAGCPHAAGLLYGRVAAGNGGNGWVKKQALLACQQTLTSQPTLPGTEPLNVSSGVAALVQDEPGDPLCKDALAWLGGQLSGLVDPRSIEQIRTAAEVAEQMNPEEWPTDGNGLAAEEMQALMPALIELNIRQARAAGYPDLAEALQSLRLSLSRHVDDRWVEDLLNDENTLEMKD